MTTLLTHTLWLPKAGNTPAEYEDAFLAAKSTISSARSAFAIADGATETLLSRQWANLLVKRFGRHWERADKQEIWLSNTLRAWQKEKRDYLRRREHSSNPVQWYEEPGLEAGAFAALLGLILSQGDGNDRTSDSDPLIWHAVAVGDCCLFQMRREQLICAFPLDQSESFNNRPYLLSSNPSRNAGIAERFVYAGGEALRGDRFYLMTDALAAWFLRTYEQDEAPWAYLDLFNPGTTVHAADAFHSEDAEFSFAEWIGEQRAAHNMRNDDVTLIQLDILD